MLLTTLHGYRMIVSITKHVDMKILESCGSESRLYRVMRSVEVGPQSPVLFVSQTCRMGGDLFFVGGEESEWYARAFGHSHFVIVILPDGETMGAVPSHALEVLC